MFFQAPCGCGSKPMVPFWIGAPPILEPILVVGLGCSLGVRDFDPMLMIGSQVRFCPPTFQRGVGPSARRSDLRIGRRRWRLCGGKHFWMATHALGRSNFTVVDTCLGSLRLLVLFILVGGFQETDLFATIPRGCKVTYCESRCL